MPFNDASKNSALDGMGGSNITHIGVHTATDPGTGTNALAGEATGGSPAYARKPITWSAAGATTAGQKNGDTAAVLTFDVPAGSYAFFTLWNNLTANTGNYKGFLPFGGAAKGFGTVNAADVTANTISSGAHGLVTGDRVMVSNVFAEALPGGTGFTEGSLLYVVGAATDTFQVSLTSGGAAIDLIAPVGELFFQKVVVEVFAAQGQITVAVNALVLDATTI